MRLLIFTYHFRQGYGVSLVIQEQIKRLKRHYGHDLYVAAYDADLREVEETTIIRTDNTKASVDKIINQVNPDAVIVHAPPYFQLLADNDNPEVIKVAYDHGEPFASFFNHRDRLQRIDLEESKLNALKKFHLHISISEFIKKHSSIPHSVVIYNGCEHINDTDSLQTDAHQYLSIPKETFLISTLSRIGVGEFQYKGLDALREIKLRLQSRGDIAFLLMGKVAEGGLEIINEFRKNGFYVVPDVDEKTKRMLIKTSGLFLSPSFWEGFNLPLVESQYLGVLSACFSTGAHPEVCPFHFSNINELIEFIKTVVEDRALCMRFAETCRDFVLRRFNWDLNVKELHNLLLQKAKEKSLGRLAQISTTYNKPTELHLGNKDIEAIASHLKRINLNGEVQTGLIKGTYRTTTIKNNIHMVSIIIPNRDCAGLLSNCIYSIKTKTSFPNWEIIIAENGSLDKETFKLYDDLSVDSNIKIIKWEHGFNYSAINNFASSHAKGDLLLFLNNDTEVINSDWIERLMDYATRKDVGAVGAKLYYPDNTIQHASVIIGIKDIAGHSHRFFPRDADGYFGRLKIPHNVSAITGACLMTRRDVFEEIDGFDENLPVAFNDIDYCLRIRQNNYLIVWTPYAELYHHESKSRGSDDDRANPERFHREYNYFKSRWAEALKKGDPYYNPNLTHELEDFSLPD